MSREQLSVKSKARNYATVVLDAEDGTPAKEWRLEYDYRGISRCEDALGIDLKDVGRWADVCKSKNFPTVVWSGLNRYHSDVTLDRVIDVLNPEAQDKLQEIVFALLHPALHEAWKKHKAELESGATADPNPPMAGTQTA